MSNRFMFVVLAGSLACATPASAVNYNLISGNSSVNVSDQTGTVVWNIDQNGRSERDKIDNIFISNYFYRLGTAGNEANFYNGLGAPVGFSSSANAVTLNFANSTLAASVSWMLMGSAQGSGMSTLTKSVAITNLTGSAVDLHLFDYSDYDINFDQLNQADTAALVGPGHILTKSATVPFQINSQATGNPDHYEITDFITPYLSLYFDTDGPTTLSDQPAFGVSYPSPPGDNAFAFEWDRTLGAGAMFSVSQVAVYGPAAIPEPATWAIIIGSLAAVVAFSRRRTNSGVA